MNRYWTVSISILLLLLLIVRGAHSWSQEAAATDASEARPMLARDPKCPRLTKKSFTSCSTCSSIHSTKWNATTRDLLADENLLKAR